MRSYFKRLSRDTLIYGISGGLSQAVGFLVLPVLTRVLAPADYGIIDFLTLAGHFLTAFMILGMNASLLRFFHDGVDEGDRRDVVVTNFAFMIVWGAFLSLLAAIWGPSVLKAIFGGAFPYKWFLLVLGICYFGTLRDNLSNLYRLLSRPRSYLLVSVLGLGVGYGSIMWLVVKLERGVEGYFIGLLAGTALATIVAFVDLSSWFRGRVSHVKLRRMIRFGIPLTPTDMAMWSMRFAERFFILRFLSAQDLGIYAIGAKFASVVVLLTYAFRLAWAPFALSIRERTDANDFYVLVDNAYKASASIFVIFLAAVSYPLLRVLTPVEYHSGYQVVGFVAYGTFFAGMYWISGLGAVFSERSAYLTLAIVMSAVVSVGLCLILTPRFGILGAAAGGAVAHASGNLAVVYLSEKAYRIGFSIRKTLLIVVWTLFALSLQIYIYERVAETHLQIWLILLLLLVSVSVLLPVGLGARRLWDLFDRCGSFRLGDQ